MEQGEGSSLSPGKASVLEALEKLDTKGRSKPGRGREYPIIPAGSEGERVRVSWGSALFSLASASPGREQEKSQREEDGALGKIQPLCSPHPQEVEAAGGGGSLDGCRAPKPGLGFFLPAPCEMCKGAGATESWNQRPGR